MISVLFQGYVLFIREKTKASEKRRKKRIFLLHGGRPSPRKGGWRCPVEPPSVKIGREATYPVQAEGEEGQCASEVPPRRGPEGKEGKRCPIVMCQAHAPWKGRGLLELLERREGWSPRLLS